MCGVFHILLKQFHDNILKAVTLKVITFAILKNVVDDNDREDDSPEVNLSKDQVESHRL